MCQCTNVMVLYKNYSCIHHCIILKTKFYQCLFFSFAHKKKAAAVVPRRLLSAGVGMRD